MNDERQAKEDIQKKRCESISIREHVYARQRRKSDGEIDIIIIDTAFLFTGV